ncbi:MerR family transcriptional regulator [Halobacillus salinarum]|uniref:MerR family transcriptional regulator n=1 Tax=Halobacillus salinarum TaxID=2932257 RepID=A0ABY4ENL6_9BACI|nr:MerR family transcriptional regulator [Halobacillus salinarum]UOQ45975.1 MerR family transcriptional regulator [Halobacillus salinarum]
MEYTVKELATIAGITGRTLRYYDQIGILKPAYTNSSGYRIYEAAEVDRLQQILFYRELDVDLDTIDKIMNSPGFSELAALKAHHDKLLAKRKQLEILIRNVEKTLALKEGRIVMSDQEKFEGFKQKLIDENEQKYGKEIREKYGDDQVDRSYQKITEMSTEQYEEAERLGQQVLEVLNRAFLTKDPSSPLAQEAADLHRQWLTNYWDKYTKEAHAGVAQMYVDDERFKAYYDKENPGTAEFLRDAIMIYTGKSKA